MSEAGTRTLSSRLENVINLHRDNDDVSYAEVLGVLEFLKFDILNELKGQEDEG